MPPTLRLPDIPLDGATFMVLCVPVLPGTGADTGLAHDRASFRMPEHWIAVLRQLLARYPDLQLPDGKLAFWQVVLFRPDEWTKGGLHKGALRPLNHAVLAAGFELGTVFANGLLAALHAASSS